jgi:hypothetical protein
MEGGLTGTAEGTGASRRNKHGRLASGKARATRSCCPTGFEWGHELQIASPRAGEPHVSQGFCTTFDH